MRPSPTCKGCLVRLVVRNKECSSDLIVSLWTVEETRADKLDILARFLCQDHIYSCFPILDCLDKVYQEVLIEHTVCIRLRWQQRCTLVISQRISYGDFSACPPLALVFSSGFCAKVFSNTLLRLAVVIPLFHKRFFEVSCMTRAFSLMLMNTCFSLCMEWGKT